MIAAGRKAVKGNRAEIDLIAGAGVNLIVAWFSLACRERLA